MQLLNVLLAFFTPLIGGVMASCGSIWCSDAGYNGVPYCTSARPTVCTVSSVQVDRSYVDLYLYDNNCNRIGFLAEVRIGSGVNFDSQLPWVVVGNVNSPTVGFVGRYAGRKVGSGAVEPNICYVAGPAKLQTCEVQFYC